MDALQKLGENQESVVREARQQQASEEVAPVEIQEEGHQQSTVVEAENLEVQQDEAHQQLETEEQGSIEVRTIRLNDFRSILKAAQWKKRMEQTGHAQFDNGLVQWKASGLRWHLKFNYLFKDLGRSRVWLRCVEADETEDAGALALKHMEIVKLVVVDEIKKEEKDVAEFKGKVDVGPGDSVPRYLDNQRKKKVMEHTQCLAKELGKQFVNSNYDLEALSFNNARVTGTAINQGKVKIEALQAIFASMAVERAKSNLENALIEHAARAMTEKKAEEAAKKTAKNKKAAQKKKEKERAKKLADKDATARYLFRPYRRGRTESCPPAICKAQTTGTTPSFASAPDQSDDESEEKSAVEIMNSRAELEPAAYVDWALTVPWTYSVDLATDFANHRAGLLLYKHPTPFFPLTDDFNPRAVNGYIIPAIISPILSPTGQPLTFYIPDTNRFVIHPHVIPFPDIRLDGGHPDCLPPSKLCEYQAAEMAGFEVWRHDRSTLSCTLPTCGQVIRDNTRSTQICHGCGTKSWVRYCSKDHLFADMPRHWSECGHPTTVSCWLIDEGSQPARFYNRYPAIQDVDRKNTSERHRQRTHAIYNKGQYTLFSDQGFPRIVTWPEKLAPIYKPRVERLLNAAFFDHTNVSLISYLFRLLRFCLRTRGKYNNAVQSAIVKQFSDEFDYGVEGELELDPCECEWVGDSAKSAKCTKECQKMTGSVGEMHKGKGLEGIVQLMEAKHWILRAWRRQHPTIKDWRRRVHGEGFEGVGATQRAVEWWPSMGQGWNGWGRWEEDICL